MPQGIKGHGIDYLQFKGTWASADNFNTPTVFIRQRRRRFRSTNATNWNTVSELEEWVDGNNRTVAIGDVYEREAFETSPGVLGTPGPWKFVGQRNSEAVRNLIHKANFARQATAVAPGQPMVDARNLDLLNPDGSAVLRPQVGAQDINPDTGGPLVNAQGQPVLVVWP